MRVEKQGAFLPAVATAHDGGRVQPGFAANARPSQGAAPARKRASKPRLAGLEPPAAGR
jgi:hypothetical protein